LKRPIGVAPSLQYKTSESLINLRSLAEGPKPRRKV
jgi:hypothetical protein